MADNTYLQLAPEFGGTKFGPFEGVEIRLGSDPARNQIRLPEELGVAPEHVKVLKQGETSFIIAPVERSAAVYLWRAGQRKPRQVTAPVAITVGDGFSLVTPEGPRFYIVQTQPRKELDDNVEGPANRKLSKGSKRIVDEIKRKGMAKFLTTSMGNWANNAWRFVKTGQIFSPFYIVVMMGTVSGWLMGGAAMGGFAWKSNQAAAAKVDLGACQARCGGGSSEDGVQDEPRAPGITQNLLGDTQWQATLEADKDFRNQYTEQVGLIAQSPDLYRWTYKETKSEFQDLKKALENQGMEPSLSRVFAYISAKPQLALQREWTFIPQDSSGDEVCGRGVAAMTYSQARRLGMINVQPDRLVSSSDEAEMEDQRRIDLLRDTQKRAGEVPTLENLDMDKGATGRQGKICLFQKGEDERANPADVAAALDRSLGANMTSGLPLTGNSFWIESRVVKYYTADFEDKATFSALKFTPTVAPGRTMKTLEGTAIGEQTAAFPIKHAAIIVARAAAIPCMAMADASLGDFLPDREAVVAARLPGEPPNIYDCITLNGMVGLDLWK